MKIAAAFIAACLLVSPAASSAAEIYLQAESYSNSYNIDWDAIRPVNDKLYGLGYPGEWTEYALSPGIFGTYDALMLCWGELGVAYTLSLAIRDADGGDCGTILFSFTGRGDCNL